MKILTALAGGLAGACTLTLLHQALKKADPAAPHVDELGMEALSTGLEKVGVEPPQGKELYNWTLTGDIIANTMYYSLAAIGGKSGASGRATFLGLMGGLGALYLPKPMRLSQEFTNRTPRTQFLTVGLYTIGGLVAGTVMKIFSGKKEKKIKLKKIKKGEVSKEWAKHKNMLAENLN